MEVLEAVKKRRSIRAFKQEVAPTELLTELMEIAIRAPSGVNSQPWEFYLVKGEALENLRHHCVEPYRQGIEPHPDLPIPDKSKGETGLQGIYRERQVALAKQIFQKLGIAKGDDKGLQDYMESMYRFYDAPIVIVIVIDQMLKLTWPVVDIGIMAQTIALGALEYGLGTCIMRAIVDYPEQVRKAVGISKSKKIMLGLALGYPDRDHPLNKFVSEREKLENLLTIVE